MTIVHTQVFIFIVSLVMNVAPARVNILAIGDSITQGGKRTQNEYTYRLPLQMLLHENNIDFDFIGSQHQGLDEGVTWPDVAPGLPFDPDHEGFYGNKTATVCQKVKDALPNYKVLPDIVLIHLGTNDQKEGDYENTIAKPLADLILTIRERNPKAVFLLGHLNFKESANAMTIRNTVEKLATKLNTHRSPVRTVHHYENWYENPEHIYTDTYDWAHPNIKGQEKMARKWFAAMQSFLKER